MIRPFGSNVELLVHVEEKPAELPTLAEAMRLPVSIGHIGYTKVARGGIGHPGYQDLLAMLRDGLFWVKLTRLHRISAEAAFAYGDMLGLLAEWEPDAARRAPILSANPARLYGF